MLPPLLSIAELQIPLPGNETHWSARYEQWQRLSPPQPASTLCAVLARIGLEDALPSSLEQPAQLTTLLSAFVQQAAHHDLLQAMASALGNDGIYQQSLVFDTSAAPFRKALDALLRAGCSQPLREVFFGVVPNDFAVVARVLSIFSFTPPRLLFPYTKWQTTEVGHSAARAEISEIVTRDIGRARHCLYHAVQVFQYFRATKVSMYFDVFGFLGCVLYMVLYVEVIEQQQLNLADRGIIVGYPAVDIVRLEQLNPEHREGWLNLSYQFRIHVTGIGLLDSGRSVARLYKESSRVMANSATISGIAGAMSKILEKQAMGCPPEFQDGQPPTQRQHSHSLG